MKAESNANRPARSVNVRTHEQRVQFYASLLNSLPQGCVMISGYGHYCINRSGQVFGCRTGGGGLRDWTLLKQTFCPNPTSRIGYGQWQAYLRSTGEKYPKHFSVSVLVLETFRGLRPAKHFDCCHNDGNHHNNNLDNLRWDTKKSNLADAIRQGRVRRGENHYMVQRMKKRSLTDH